MSFDSYGVSGHPNHISIAMALEHLVSTGMLEGVQVWLLESISIFRKYIGIIDLLFSQNSIVSLDLVRNYRAMQIHHS